jgi:hypothetical protein
MNFITGKHLSRRTFLRGMGATVALPLLDGMIPAGKLWRDPATQANNTRLICIEESMGTAGASEWGWSQNLYAPLTSGKDFVLPERSVLEPLVSEFRDYVTVVSNTDSRMAEPYTAREIGGDHDRSSSVFLTQSHPRQTQGSDIYLGVSLDQLHAQKFGQDTALPSLELCIESPNRGGACNYDYHCAYRHNISWAAPNKPLPALRDPRAVFERMFGSGDNNADRAVRRQTQQSMLDWLVGETARFKRSLSAVDRAALDGYLDQIREIERRIELIEARNSSGEERALPEAPVGVPDSWDDHMELMMDLQVLALQSEITRVISFKTGTDQSNISHPASGVDGSWHGISHHGNDPASILQFLAINTYRLKSQTYLLKKLRDTTEAGVPLLDKTAIVFGSGMGDPNVHNHRRCPLVLMGKANGALEGNMHVMALEGTPMANVFVSLMQGIGHHDLTTFGDSTGRVPLTMPARSTAAVGS